MQNFTFTGKRRFVVSNRVFWAVVVLTAAALLGRDTGRAAPDEIKTKRITAQSLHLMDSTGKASIDIYALPNEAIINLTSDRGRQKLGLLCAPTSGPNVIFTTKGKTQRIVGADISKAP